MGVGACNEESSNTLSGLMLQTANASAFAGLVTTLTLTYHY